MPAEFQRVMDFILSELPNAHAFIDDSLVLSKGTEIEHISIAENFLMKSACNIWSLSYQN